MPYFIEAIDSVGLPTGDYEYGIGTYSAANSLTRTTVLGSSNGGAAVDFTAGSKNVGQGLNRWTIENWATLYAPAGTVLQEVSFPVQTGTTTNSPVLTGMALSQSITPKSASSRITVTCTFEGAQSVVAGVNPFAYFDLNIGGAYIGEERRLGAGQSAGGAGITVPITLVGEYVNSSLSPVGINIGARTSTAACFASAYVIKFFARETKR